MFKSNKNITQFIINDNGQNILIKQPKINELNSLYYILLHNLIKLNKPWREQNTAT